MMSFKSKYNNFVLKNVKSFVYKNVKSSLCFYTNQDFLKIIAVSLIAFC